MTTTKNLTGSDKQIAWATDIRNGILARIETALGDRTGKPEQAGQILRDAIADVESAKAIIDRRDRHNWSSMAARSPMWATLDQSAKLAAQDADAMMMDMGY